MGEFSKAVQGSLLRINQIVFKMKGNYSGPICIRKTNRRACT